MGSWHQVWFDLLTPLTRESLLELDHIFMDRGEATLHDWL